jgi:acyl-CoA thioesterase FadM
MITVRLRLGLILARWLLRERHQPDQPVSRLALRCHWPDCDINRHMNNSRYLGLMDLGRYHYMLVSGLGREVWRRRWFPVLARAEIDFKKSLAPGDRFVLETRLEAVGTKSATLVQRFWLGDELVAEARVVGLFVHKGRSQALTPLMEDHAHLLPSPAQAEQPALLG